MEEEGEDGEGEEGKEEVIVLEGEEKEQGY